MTGDPWLAIRRHLDNLVYTDGSRFYAEELLWDGKSFRFGYWTHDGVQQITHDSAGKPLQFATLDAVAEWCAAVGTLLGTLLGTLPEEPREPPK